MSESTPPQHAFEVTVKIGGDDWNYVLRVMRELAIHLEEHGPECGLTSGGAGGSHSVSIQRRDISPDDFRKELQAWHEGIRSAKT